MGSLNMKVLIKLNPFINECAAAGVTDKRSNDNTAVVRVSGGMPYSFMRKLNTAVKNGLFTSDIETNFFF